MLLQKLYVSGAPDSNTFDVTLMIALLRNLTSMSPPVGGFDRLPLSSETSEGADLARIKHYRNYLAHQDAPLIDNTFFTAAWKDLSDVSTKCMWK